MDDGVCVNIKLVACNLKLLPSACDWILLVEFAILYKGDNFCDFLFALKQKWV